MWYSPSIDHSLGLITGARGDVSQCPRSLKLVLSTESLTTKSTFYFAHKQNQYTHQYINKNNTDNMLFL